MFSSKNSPTKTAAWQTFLAAGAKIKLSFSSAGIFFYFLEKEKKKTPTEFLSVLLCTSLSTGQEDAMYREDC